MAIDAEISNKDRAEQYKKRLDGLVRFRNPHPYPVTFGHDIGRGVGPCKIVVDAAGQPILNPELFFYVDKGLLVAEYNKPKPVQQAPVAVKPAPAPVKQNPPPVKQEPAPVKREPPQVKREPAPVKQEPPQVKQETAAPTPKAAPVTEKAALVVQKPVEAQTPAQKPEVSEKAPEAPAEAVEEENVKLDYIYNSLGHDSGYFIEIPFEDIEDDAMLEQLGNILEVRHSTMYKEFGLNKQAAIEAIFTLFGNVKIVLSKNRLKKCDGWMAGAA